MHSLNLINDNIEKITINKLSPKNNYYYVIIRDE